MLNFREGIYVIGSLRSWPISQSDRIGELCRREREAAELTIVVLGVRGCDWRLGVFKDDDSLSRSSLCALVTVSTVVSINERNSYASRGSNVGRGNAGRGKETGDNDGIGT